MANTTTTRTKDEGRTTMGQATEKAQDFASEAMDKAKHAASSVGSTLSSAASSAGQTADNLASSAGSGLKNLGDTLREHTPREGMLGGASQAVADTLRDSGRYLEQEGLSGMFDDMGGLIRSHPMSAILVAFGVGFLVGMTLKS